MTRAIADLIADLGTGIHIDGQWREAASGATFELMRGTLAPDADRALS